MAKLVAHPACYGSSLCSNPDISQQYKMGDIGKGVANTLLRPPKNKKNLKNDLKGHGNDADFLGFLQKLVPHRSLTHYLSSRSDFGFEFAEIFVIENRLCDSTSREVGDSPIRDLCRTDLCKNPRKSASLPCPFK